MSQPTRGQTVLVPTDVKDGAFPGERLVTVTTATGPISGFAKADFIVKKENGQYLMAEVKGVSKSGLTVRLFGSFFTTTGLADIPKGVALQKG